MADNAPDPDESSDPAAQNPVAEEEGGEGWSDPIFFYPDGTTSDARFIVASNRGCGVHVKLRGVTGNVSMGEPIPIQE